MDALRIYGKRKFGAEFNCRLICKQRVNLQAASDRRPIATTHPTRPQLSAGPKQLIGIGRKNVHGRPPGFARPPALLSNCCQNWSPAWTPSCRIRLATAPTVTIGHRNTKFVFLARWSEGGQKL